MMRKLSMSVAAMVTAAFSLQAVPCHAHGIWFAQRAERLALVYGDGAEDLDAVKRLPKITSVGGTGMGGKPVQVKLEVEGRLPIVDLTNKPEVVTATMNNGLWSKTSDGKWHGKGKDEVPDALVSGRYMKYATHLVNLPIGARPPAPGLVFQVVPVTERFPTNKDETLTVQVLFEGKPLPGAKVWQDAVTDPDGTPVVADQNGRATVRVRNQGLNVIKAEHESAPVDPGKANMTHHLATLSFALAAAPE